MSRKMPARDARCSSMRRRRRDRGWRCARAAARRPSPSATAAATAAWPGSKRRLKPIWNGTPAAVTAASARSTSARSSDTGFSQKIALPARAASIDQVGVASASACRSRPRRRRPRRGARRRRRPRARAELGRRRRAPCPASASWTAVSRAPGTCAREQLGVHAADAPGADHADRATVFGRGRASIQSSLSDTTSSQRPVCTDLSSAACTLTHSTASSNPGENGRSSATARQNS